MITLKTITGKIFYLNCELIYRVDETFDTIITLVDGKTLRVSNTGEEIAQKVLVYKQKIMNKELLAEGTDKE